MSAAPMLWTTADQTCSHRPRRPRVLPETLGGAIQRCPRCEIPLGSRPCPNPLCREQHGQSAGTLCAWCRHHAQEPRERSAVARLHNLERAVGQRAPARVG
jgi:hypothetical protein